MRFSRPSPGSSPAASLTVKFGLISALLAAGARASGLSTWLDHFIHETNVSQTESTAEYSMRLVMNDIGITPTQKVALTAAQTPPSPNCCGPWSPSETYEGAVAWDPAAPIAYAAEQAEPGRTEKARPEVDQAMQGTTSLPSSSVNQALRYQIGTERAAIARYGPTLETFVPVRLAGHVAAAVEFYRQWRPVQAQIQRRDEASLLAGRPPASLPFGSG